MVAAGIKKARLYTTICPNSSLSRFWQVYNRTNTAMMPALGSAI